MEDQVQYLWGYLMSERNQNQTAIPVENWWSKPGGALLEELEVKPEKGLASEQVKKHREAWGGNRFEERGPTSLWVLLWESIKSPMMLLLLSIAAISLMLGQFREAAVMAFVVAMYVGIHLLNKARSDRTMARLREVQAPRTVVRRAGEEQKIPFEDVVCGDILPLRAGSQVPADARLISTAGLVVDESALTGESAPVHKDAEAEVDAGTPLAERRTAIYAGTTVHDGEGLAVVAATGEDSELGHIAALSTRQDEEETPLQKEMSDLARTLAYAAVAVSLLIALAGLLWGFALQEMVLTWLSLTFLMVPGQPPIIIAMALALAAISLSEKHVIVRRLHGAETLGAVNVVLSDKTGTMTENEMKLSAVLLPDGRPLPFEEAKKGEPERLKTFLQTALAAIPANSNDPTDVAVRQAVKKVEDFEPYRPGRLVDLVGFSRGAAFRILAYVQDGQQVLFVAGGPEEVLERSQDAGGSALQEQIARAASEGKRITAYACQRGSEDERDDPHNLHFAGVAILSDPLRPEVKGAVKRLQEAGVRTVMVTGDIAETAGYVAKEAGLDTGAGAVMGPDLEGMTGTELEALVQERSVFARTTPQQKMMLVQACRRAGLVTAVTGDGINDAPALHAADIGVAMGEKGTDVAREAADLVLTDDSFAHLPAGVEIGRKAYENFRKGITYYLSAKAILLFIFIVPLLAGVSFPFSPIQIIFTELLMDLASSTIFLTEEAEPGLMQRGPRRRQRFLSWRVAGRILRNMAGLSAAILAVYFGSLSMGYALESARTAAFAAWLLGHILLAMNVKQEKTPLVAQGLLSNRFAAGWLVGMVLFVLGMTFWPFMQNILGTTPLSGWQWVMVIAGALAASMWMEVVKWLRPRNTLFSIV